MQFTLTFSPAKREPVVGNTLSQLHMAIKIAIVERASNRESFQIQLNRENDDGITESLNAFFNAHRAWLIWNNQDGKWLYPINAKWRDFEPDEEQDCTIENGQLDSYTVRWSHSRDRAMKVINYYFETGNRAPWLHWTSEEYWLE